VRHLKMVKLLKSSKQNKLQNKIGEASANVKQMLAHGYALHQKGFLNEAQRIYYQILNVQPSNFDALQLAGAIELEAKNYKQAVKLLSKSIKLNPNIPNIHCNLSIAYEGLGQIDNAITNYDQAIRLNPNYVEAYCDRGNALQTLKQFDAAITNYDQAIRLNPNFAEAYSNRGNALQALEKFDAAITNYDQAIRLNPNFAEAYSNRGNALQALKQLDAAMTNYDQAIRLNPNFAEAYSNRGNALQALEKFDAAITNYDQAIRLNPNFAEAYSNRGNALQALKQLDAAMTNYDHAIRLHPKFAEAHFNRGRTLSALKLPDSALTSYLNAFRICPETEYLLDYLIYTKLQLCDWEDLDKLSAQFIKKITKNNKTGMPFVSLFLSDKPNIHRQCATMYVDEKYPVNNLLGPIKEYPKNKKIRIGYFSADFHNHATMLLMAEIFEYHDKSKFELIAFSFGLDKQDQWKQRVMESFDQFINVNTKSDIEIASLSRQLAIDIAIDLKGYTEESRTSIFAHRAAPIQVSYLGYPGTMGSDYIDYIIADHIVIPEKQQEHFSEKIVYLPNSYQANISHRTVSDKIFNRQEMGLPLSAFVFCSFNNNYKITPDIFDSWMRILQAVEGSVLWIFKNNESSAKNLKKEAELRGINESRLIFASLVPVEEHLKRIQLADLFLDTNPINAHTTASDSLRVGLPLITLAGESFASRVAASLLSAVGLPELITLTPERYESLAIELGTHPEKIKSIKKKLLGNLPDSALYNSKLFTQNLERAYQLMYRHHHNKLAPEHILI